MHASVELKKIPTHGGFPRRKHLIIFDRSDGVVTSVTCGNGYSAHRQSQDSTL